MTDVLVSRLYRQALTPLGLTHPQYLVLLALWEDGRRSMRDLRALLCTDTGTLSPLVKRMERAGLVSRTRDARDERQVWVELTERGWALRDEAVEARREVVRNLPLTEAGLAALRETLRGLNAALLAGPAAAGAPFARAEARP